MQRLGESRSGDDGIALIWVVLGLATLLGVAAYVIDVGALFEERRQLQNGADAAALAIAYECVESVDACTQTTADGIAAEYVPANARDGDATVTSVILGAASVTVEVETLNDGEGFVAPFFSQFLGNSGVTVVAAATAEWSIGILPVTVSWCEMELFFGSDWEDQLLGTGAYAGSPRELGPEVFTFHTAPGSDTDCDGPAGQDLPGGFGLLETVGGNCIAEIIGDEVGASPGNGVATFVQECASFFPRNGSYGGPVPIFIAIHDGVRGSGANGVYTIYDLYSVEVGRYKWGGSLNSSPRLSPTECAANESCVELTFTGEQRRTGNPSLVRLTG